MGKSFITPWGKEVKKAMIDMNISMNELAELTGFSRQYLYMIINGRRLGAYEAEEKISSVLNVTYPYPA